MIVWIIGLSGAGKTTVSRALVKLLRAGGRPTLFLDGDDLRGIWSEELGHSMEDRRRNHMRFSKLSKLLDQGGDVNVVIAALSIFPDLRRWNRENINSYFEVFLDVPLEVIEKRDPKKLYERARKGQIQNVVGVDIPFEPPREADLTIRPPQIFEPPEQIAAHIHQRLFPA